MTTTIHLDHPESAWAPGEATHPEAARLWREGQQKVAEGSLTEAVQLLARARLLDYANQPQDAAQPRTN